MSIAGPRLILDITRTIGRALNAAPTGIDRVEVAYLRELLVLAPDRLDFAIVLPFTWRILPRAAVRRLLTAIDRRWGSGTAAPPLLALAALIAPALIAPMLPGRRRARPCSVYLLVSHLWLERPHGLRRMLKGENAAMVCLVHDLIPIEMPEYVRVGEAEIHARRMRNVGALAAGVITNSQATTDSLRRFLGDTPLPIVASLLGVDAPPPPEPLPVRLAGIVYFVTIGTIEPRKNHLLLLHLWRRFAATLGPAAPRLLMIGRRGWENENIVDLLDRAPGLAGLVEEHSGLSDRAVHALLRGARALLFPSFAEGYGLPLAEALAVGAPAIVADLPALREVGRDVAEYLDPLDAPAWSAAILDYIPAGSRRRAAQVARMAGWHRPEWRDHVNDAVALADRVAA